MSIKKTLQEKRAKVELTDEIVRNCLCNPDTYDKYKNLADDGGMEGVKDAAHLEKIIRKKKADLMEAYQKEKEADWKGSVNKHRPEDKDIPSPINGDDLPNRKPLPTLRQVKRANWRWRPRPKKKQKITFVSGGHFESNRRKH